MNCLTVCPSIRLAVVENGYLAFDVESDRVHFLNPTAALILEHCDGTHSLADIQANVVPLLPKNDPKIVADWLRTAERDGLITRVSDGPAAPHEITADELGGLARRLQEEGHVREAFLSVQRATELQPDDGDLWYQLGELAHIVGARDVARSAYQRYLEFVPDDDEIKHILIALCDQQPPDRTSDECIHQLYARFSKFYDTNMRDELDYRAPEELLTALATHLPPASAQLRILDLGCGTGFVGKLLRPWAAHLVGIDLSPEMIDRARKQQVYDTLEVAEITAWLAANEQTYDVVIACDCLIYFGELGQVLGPAARRLAPAGLLGFTVENGEQSPSRLTDSGRYSHHADYVLEAASRSGLTLLSQSESVIRIEYGTPTVGLISIHRAATPAQT